MSYNHRRRGAVTRDSNVAGRRNSKQQLSQNVESLRNFKPQRAQSSNMAA